MLEHTDNIDWKVFEENDGNVITNSMAIVAENHACIAVQFENEFRSMSEDYTRLIKFNNGEWTAEDYDQKIVVVANLRDRYDLTRSNDIYMMFINDIGETYFIGKENKQINIYEELGLQDCKLQTFLASKLYNDRIFLFNRSLLFEYKDGKFTNISNGLYNKNVDPFVSIPNLRDIILLDNTYYVGAMISLQVKFFFRKIEDYDWIKIDLKTIETNGLVNIVHDGEHILIFTRFYIAKFNIKTHSIMYQDTDRQPYVHYIKYNETIYAIAGDMIVNMSSNKNILEGFTKKYNKGIYFYKKYEIYNDRLYIFGPLSSFITIDKNEKVTVYEAPEMVINVSKE